MGDGCVQIAYLHSHKVSHSWHESMMRLVGYDAVTEGRIVGTAGPFMIRCDSGGIVEGRNLSVTRFLDETEHEWLFLIDTDMGFLPDTVERLLQAADPVERPVVGALCFGARELAYDGYGGRRIMPVPTIYSIARTPEGHVGFSTRWDFPADTVLQVAATGAACLLIHRSAVEKLRADHGNGWFDQVRYQDGRLLSEDMSFCYRLGAAGIKIFVHTGVKTTHHKQVWIGADDYVPPAAELATENVPDISVHVDIPTSVKTLVNNEHVHDNGMLKLPADLDRYKAIIEATKPEVIVETGTRTGASAQWFAAQGLDVVTVDVNQSTERDGLHLGNNGDTDIWFLTGDSADPAIAAKVAGLVAGRRCMVVLDSDHSGPHVTKEIELYGLLVTPGCYLVVEDTILGYASEQVRAAHGMQGMAGSPLHPVGERLAGDPGWLRDVAIERMSPVSHHPAGWWVRNG